MDPIYRSLIVCTSHADFPGRSQKTGLWLSEATHFYDELSSRNLPYDIASPKGGAVPIDEKSFDRRDTTNEKWYHNPAFRQKLEQSTPLSDVDPSAYQIVFFSGGHGALWDFPDNPDVHRIARYVYENGGMIAAVGHGVCGLVNVTLSDGTPLIGNRQLTGFSNMEEKLLRVAEEIPFLLEDALKGKNALYSKGLLPFVTYIEMDERLVTGQNPLSARKVGRKVLEEMYEK
ncbi:type 1 glutamine amidotransferase domain-containing protein [Spirosoma sp. KUDC1026]|uniref:type 1 glutamine amidotransferase domain-containing protein n=1 Tax=Spirosoma sp. KUDC1026 TaxID=2745947 RepID=UPI00159BE695|nr:type 1 glutamine amidotransferase domain-containing protein [Spirosoma sp. KUDC1026]QKZ12410.1 type 1 glutamine amidotransferase domain-containing protein [Spirosoma sp. KUDC1026]